MNEQFTYANSKGYVFNAATGKLEEFIPLTVWFHLDDRSVSYDAIVGGQCIDVKHDENFKLYESPQSFESDKAKPFYPWDVSELLQRCNLFLDEQMKPYGWSFKKGQPYKHYLEGCKISKHYYCENGEPYGPCPFTLVGLPQDVTIYKSREYSVAMNELVIVDKDGNETRQVGAGKRISLTLEQQKLMNEFVKAGRALADAGVQLIIESSSSVIKAYNKNVIDTWSLDGTEESSPGWAAVDGYMFKVPLDLHGYNEECDYVNVKFKE